MKIIWAQFHKKVVIIGRFERVFFRRIRFSEVIFALKKMKSRRALGLDGILIEAWKCMGNVGVLVDEIF